VQLQSRILQAWLGLVDGLTMTMMKGSLVYSSLSLDVGKKSRWMEGLLGR
jgi:hypothetical protein